MCQDGEVVTTQQQSFLYNSSSRLFLCSERLMMICEVQKIFFRIDGKSLKVFRLKATILGLKFVNLVMFNCSSLSKTCLNVYRPTSPILSLPGTSCKLLSGAPSLPPEPSWAKLGLARSLLGSSGLPWSLLVTPGDPWWLLFTNDVNEKKGD